MAHDLATARSVDASPNSIADRDPADVSAAEVSDHALERPPRVVHQDLALGTGQAARVTDLASRLGVEGTPVQVHLDLVAFAHLSDLQAVSSKGHHGALVLCPVVPGEVRGWERPKVCPAAGRGAAGALPLFGHGRSDAVAV